MGHWDKLQAQNMVFEHCILAWRISSLETETLTAGCRICGPRNVRSRHASYERGVYWNCSLATSGWMVSYLIPIELLMALYEYCEMNSGQWSQCKKCIRNRIIQPPQYCRFDISMTGGLGRLVWVIEWVGVGRVWMSADWIEFKKLGQAVLGPHDAGMQNSRAWEQRSHTIPPCTLTPGRSCWL